MKRAMTGGAHRGPVGEARQRRTLRFVQGLLVVLAVVLLLSAGYSMGKTAGYDEARTSDGLSAPKRPPVAMTVVLALLGIAALEVAVILQGREGVRIPVPSRLEELAGRAESVAVDKVVRSSEDAG